jgi:hypothetical protein
MVKLLVWAATKASAESAMARICGRIMMKRVTSKARGRNNERRELTDNAAVSMQNARVGEIPKKPTKIMIACSTLLLGIWRGMNECLTAGRWIYCWVVVVVADSRETEKNEAEERM